jgi:6-phosphogluconolactonase
MEPTIKIFETIEEIAHYFASLLVLRATETPASRDFSWMLSGGNTPKVLFRKIAASCKNTIDWDRVQVFWGDERCVGPDNIESNYKMARESLLDHVPISASKIFRIHGEAEPVTEAERYALQFRQHVNTVQGIPQTDLLMLGLGDDGHTASIFPSNLQLFNSDKLFELAEHPETRQKRITATGKIINHARLVVIIATGKGKALKVSQILNHANGCDKLPAALVNPENGEVIWLLDREAAGLPR